MADAKDDVKRRLIRSIRGTLAADDAVTRITRQAADGTWAYASFATISGEGD